MGSHCAAGSPYHCVSLRRIAHKEHTQPMTTQAYDERTVMLTVFCTWQRSRNRWRFREFVSLMSERAMNRRRRKFKGTPKAFVKLPNSFLDLVEGKRKKHCHVCVTFYKLQESGMLPLPRL